MKFSFCHSLLFATEEEEAVCYLEIQVVQVLQSGEVQLTNLINHIVLEEDGLNRDTKEDVCPLVVRTNKPNICVR